MKKIKVIDLLNMLANKEYDKLPDKIKYCNRIHKFDREYLDYLCYIENNGTTLFFLANKFKSTKIVSLLNDDVEIIEEPILDEKEKEYLSYVIRPFRNKVEYIIKYNSVVKENRAWIAIQLAESNVSFPLFEKGTMYKNMKLDKKYTLEELGL